MTAPTTRARVRLRLACPICSCAVRRSRRSVLQRWVFGAAGGDIGRYRCTDSACAWVGLIDRLGQNTPPPPRVWLTRLLRGLAPMALAAVAVAAASWGAAHAPVATVDVGARLFAPGEVFDGEPLPVDHPLLAVGLTLADAGTAPTAAGALPTADEVPSRGTSSTDSTLRLRRFCAWGRPGRMPYRGTVDEALRAAQVPAPVRLQIVAAVAAGRATDQLVIGNDGIRAAGSGREFDPRRFAMTYGRTLCLGARVNFKPGHVEPARLFEAEDPSTGRLYSVMVPKVCGNVSVLNRRPQPGRASSTQVATVGDPWDPGEPGPHTTHTAMTDKPNEVPAPGTLALTLLALAAAAAVRLRGARRRPLP